MLLLVFLALLVQHGGASTYHVTFLGRDPSETSLTTIGELQVKASGAEPTISSASSCTGAEWVGTEVKTLLLNNPDCSTLLPNGVGITRNGIKVESGDDFRLHVYQNDKAGTVGDGYLAIPDEHLGDEYYVATYCTLGGMCQFAVTATADSTNVVVVFPDKLYRPPACVNEMPIPSSVQGGTNIPFLINEGETLHFESSDDLSGVYIKADKNVGVVVGARDVPVAGSTSKTSNMIEQIIPIKKWGTKFVVMPNYHNKAGDIIKIVTKTVGTVVHIVGYTPFMIEQAGHAVEMRIDWQLHSLIMTTHPVMIIQIMSVDLYNDTDDVTGSPSMVIVPHVGQWTTEDLYYECGGSASDMFAVVTGTADETNIMDVSSINMLVDWETVEGSEFEVMVAAVNETSETIHVTTETEVGAYGFCNENSAVLLAANWSINYSECKRTPSMFGDDVDNDCNNLVDDLDCTMEDLNLRLFLTQNRNNQIIKSLPVQGINTVKFAVSTCDVAMVTLKNTDDTKRRTTIMITANEVMFTYSEDSTSSSHIDNASLTNYDCATSKEYELSWLNGPVILKYDGGSLPKQPPSTSDPREYDEIIFSAFLGEADFLVYQTEKDCPNVYRGAGKADSYGTEFLIPVFSTDFNFHIGVTNIGPTQANFTFSTSPEEHHTLGVTEIAWIDKADVAGTSYTGITLTVENDAEVSVYVIREQSTGISQGFSLIPSDVLGPSYYLFSPNLTELATENKCELFSLGFDTEVTGAPTVPEGGRQDIDSTMHDDLGYGKVLQAMRPISVFCGRDNVYVQMPPPRALGVKYFIPPIDFTAVSADDCLINIVATEDSTIVIIKGDYHQLDSVSLTGDTYTRNMESETLYDIESTKPIQVHLELSGATLKSVILIPPVTQYMNSSALLLGPDESSSIGVFAVEVDGTILSYSSPENNLLVTENKQTFIIGFFVYNGFTFVVTNQQKYGAINEQCVITPTVPGDGIDNDCDGLVDEEECTTKLTAGEIDVDIDGDINEDCAENTNPPATSRINIEVKDTMTSCATGSGSGSSSLSDSGSGDDIEIGLTTAPDSGAKHFLTPVDTIQDEIRMLEPISSPPKLVLDTITTTPSPGFKLASELPCTTQCPCGWVGIAKFYTKAELERKVQSIQRELTVSKETLSATIRKKVSIKDDRASATTVGWSAVIAVVFMIGSIVVLDISTIVKDMKMFANNIRQILRR